MTNQEIHNICKKYGIENYIINPDGSINVDGDVDLSRKKLTKIPLDFHTISGDFSLFDNQLTSLFGSPIKVGGYFDCSVNKLTDLYGCPYYVNGNFDCSANWLKTLEDCPRHITGYFDCSYNILTSLKGVPKTIGMGFDCSHNYHLTSLKGGPVVNESYYYYCQMKSLVSLEGYNGDYDRLHCYNKSNLVKKHKRSKTLKLLKDF